MNDGPSSPPALGPFSLWLARPDSQYRRPEDPYTALKRHADPHAAPPHDAAFLFHPAMEQLEPVGHSDHRENLKTGTAGGIIDQPASNHARLSGGYDLGLRGFGPDGPNALIKPLHFDICRHGHRCCDFAVTAFLNTRGTR